MQSHACAMHSEVALHTALVQNLRWVRHSTGHTASNSGITLQLLYCLVDRPQHASRQLGTEGTG